MGYNSSKGTDYGSKPRALPCAWDSGQARRMSKWGKFNSFVQSASGHLGFWAWVIGVLTAAITIAGIGLARASLYMQLLAPFSYFVAGLLLLILALGLLLMGVAVTRSLLGWPTKPTPKLPPYQIESGVVSSSTPDRQLLWLAAHVRDWARHTRGRERSFEELSLEIADKLGLGALSCWARKEPRSPLVHISRAALADCTINIEDSTVHFRAAKVTYYDPQFEEDMAEVVWQS